MQGSAASQRAVDREGWISVMLEPSRRILCVPSQDFGSLQHLLVLPAQPQYHLCGDEALLCFSLANVLWLCSIFLPQLPWIKDEYWINGYQPGWVGAQRGPHGQGWPQWPLPSLARAGGGTQTVTYPHSCQYLWPPVTATGPRPCWGLCAGWRGWCCHIPLGMHCREFLGLGEQGGGDALWGDGDGSSMIPGLQDLALQATQIWGGDSHWWMCGSITLPTILGHTGHQALSLSPKLEWRQPGQPGISLSPVCQG